MRNGPLPVAAQAVALLALTVAAASLRDLGPSLGFAKRAGPNYGYVAFTNCWTSGSSGGARSELDFYADKPTDYGNAKPDASTVTSNGSNYEWEDKPDQFQYGDNANVNFKFLLNSGAKAALDGVLVGSASAGSASFDVYKNRGGKDLYSDPPFGCQMFYHAVPKGSATSTTSGPSSASTATPTATSSGVPAAATTTAAAAPANGSPGLSHSAQIGIGVGVGLGGAALIAVLALVLLRWLRSRNAPNRGQEPGIEQDPPIAKHGIENVSVQGPGIDGSSHYASTQAT